MGSRGDNAASGSTAAPVPWRRAFRRHLTTLLVLKLVALSVLWALFFSPTHRSVIDNQALERRLVPARVQPAPGAVAAAGTAGQEAPHD